MKNSNLIVQVSLEAQNQRPKQQEVYRPFLDSLEVGFQGRSQKRKN